MLIEAKNLTKVYGRGENQVAALREVDLEIAPGDFISIMGPSGSGKSTLLHLLSGLDRPTSGSLSYDGQDIYGLRDKEPLLLDRRNLSGEDLEQLAQLLGIEERLTHLPHELSGGQQQRVAIARALIARPDIIFADEPTGNLDSKSGGEVMKLLEDIWQKMGKTLVVITHDGSIAQRAKRQFVIMDGVVTEKEE